MIKLIFSRKQNIEEGDVSDFSVSERLLKKRDSNVGFLCPYKAVREVNSLVFPPQKIRLDVRRTLYLWRY